MTIGPAMSARALDQAREPAADGAAPDGTALLAAELDAILAELRRLNAA